MRRIHAVTMVLVLIGAASVSADRVRLRSGKAVEGIYIGGDSRAVRLLLEDGRVAEFELDKVTAVDFDTRKPAVAPAAGTAPAATATRASTAAPSSRPAPAAKPRPILVPAGTALNVRLTQAISVDASQAGMKFKALVDDPVMIGGVIAIPRGASAVLHAGGLQHG